MVKKELENLTDRQLIQYLITGNEEVVKYIFYEKCSSMFGYILKEVFAYKVDKDELISELYLLLNENDWEKVRRFEYRSRFTTWLSVIAVRYFIKKRNTMIDSHNNLPLNNKEITDIPNQISYDHFMEKFDLYNAINKLKNPRDRFVIMAIDIEGKEDKEIATVLGVKIENLYNIKKRARKQLSNILNEYNYVN